MTQETRDIIYNKKAEELNKDEVGYINQLLNKKLAGFNFWLITLVSPILGFVLPLALTYPIVVEVSMFLPFMTGTGIVLGPLLGAMFYSTAPTLKSLGLTRKDWKELKKSGRLKELKQIVKEYNQSLKSELDDLYEREEEITAEINVKEAEQKALLSELVEIHNLKEQKQRKPNKTPTYTQKEVKEMLKIEENLLLKCLERVKQAQAMISEDDADEKTINEVGENIRNRDYLTHALENCKQFNEELDRETFDN